MTTWRAPALAILGVVAAAAAVSAALVALLVGGVADGEPDRASADGSGGTASARGEDATREGPEGWTPWTWRDDDSPVRWDPCSTIELVVRPDGMPAGFDGALSAAIAEVEEASGLRLEVTATTDEAPSGDRAAYQPERYGRRWAPVLVAAAAPGTDGLPLAEDERAAAMPVAVGEPGAQVYVTGQLMIADELEAVTAGSDDRRTSLQALLQHELAHLVGLDHVDDPEQLLYPHPLPGPVAFGDGDRRGLAALGEGGCLEAPAARAVEVERAR